MLKVGKYLVVPDKSTTFAPDLKVNSFINQFKKKGKLMELYFVYALGEDGSHLSDKKVTDKEHLETCIKELKWELGVSKVYVNKADMAFCGWLVQGDFCGTF